MRPAAQETRSTRFFDRLTRRAALMGGAASLAALGARPATAQVATPAPEASPTAAASISLLFVQYAGPTTIAPGSGEVHTLTMTDIRSQTQYFSDRPNRIAGAEPTASFVDSFAQAFAGSPPNASLVGHLESGAHEQEAVVLTLRSAAYDEAAATLTYEVTLLDAELITDRAFEREPLTLFDAPREYAEASLFIDNAGAGMAIPFYVDCTNHDCSTADCCAQACADNDARLMGATQNRCLNLDPFTGSYSASWSCSCRPASGIPKPQ